MTLTLPERIAWLHSKDGPQGWMSHDSLAKILGTTRQTVISWEKDGGPEPKGRLRAAVAEFSGFPEVAFSRALAEAPQAATIRSRLEELADLSSRGFEALGVTPDQLRPPEAARNRTAP